MLVDVFMIVFLLFILTTCFSSFIKFASLRILMVVDVYHYCFLSFRCIVMVGLPYPNIFSPELKEKMTYLDVTLGVRENIHLFRTERGFFILRRERGKLCLVGRSADMF